MPPSDPFGLLGQVLDGHFRVERCVGEGGFSIVYKGTHIGLSEPIAIKCLKLPAALGSAIVDSFVKRFRDESRLQYKLSQGNLYVVRSIASGTTIAPATSALVPYTVLEWLDGRSLATEFNDRRERGLRGRSVDDVVRLLDSAVDAIAYAHSQGVVHRDLNPGNFFLARTAAGVKLKVLDFGVAKVMADSVLAMPSARTVGNLRMFAPAYGAPEQFDERVGAVGPWTDVYALALVTLEALSDRTVMDGEHVGEFAMRALDPSRRPTPRAVGIVVGDEVERLFARAVALAPGDRPRDAGELWGMFKHAIQVDARPGLGAAALEVPSRPSAFDVGSTLRIDEPAPSAKRPAIEIVRALSGAGPDLSARGGTLRVDASSQHNPLVLAARREAEDARARTTTPIHVRPPDSEPIPLPPQSLPRLALIMAIALLLAAAVGLIVWSAAQVRRDAPSAQP